MLADCDIVDLVTKSFSKLFIIFTILGILIVIAVIFFLQKFINTSHSPLITHNQEGQAQETSQRSQAKSPFYDVDGLVMEHFWPLDKNAPHMKGDESEILVYNNSGASVEFVSTNMDYLIDGQSEELYSGTWEKFPSSTSWERIDYVNIDASHYKGEKLILENGQKGKIHYHYKFSKNISGTDDQRVKIKLIIVKNGEEQLIEKELTRKEKPVQNTFQDKNNYNNGH